MKRLICLLILINCLSCKKNDGPNYSLYSAVAAAAKQDLVTENFIDNHNAWNFIDTGFRYNPNTADHTVCQLTPAGQMTISASSSLGDQFFRYDQLATLPNFELECEIKLIRIKPNPNNDNRAACYMEWGHSNPNEYGNFIKFENNGLIDFGDPHGNTRAGVPVEGLQVNDFNKYTIRKAGNDIYYFVNEKFIGKTELQFTPGIYIGFRIFGYNVFGMKNFRFVKF